MALVTMDNPEALKAAGVHYPESIHAWRWLYRHREDRGLAGAFRRIGRRVLVDTDEYLKLVKAGTH